jgi:hypothetical protein
MNPYIDYIKVDYVVHNILVENRRRIFFNYYKNFKMFLLSYFLQTLYMLSRIFSKCLFSIDE